MAPRFAFVPARWLAKDSGLTAFDRLTLCVLCQWVNRESGECFPSIATVAEHACISENVVRRCIGRLEAFGALQIQRRKNAKNEHVSNLYTILGYDPPAARGGTSPHEVPLPHRGGYRTSPEGVGVLPVVNPNVLKANKAVNTAGPAAETADRPSKPTGPTDLARRPLDIPEPGPISPEAQAEWRATLERFRPKPPSPPLELT